MLFSSMLAASSAWDSATLDLDHDEDMHGLQDDPESDCVDKADFKYFEFCGMDDNPWSHISSGTLTGTPGMVQSRTMASLACSTVPSKDRHHDVSERRQRSRSPPREPQHRAQGGIGVIRPSLLQEPVPMLGMAHVTLPIFRATWNHMLHSALFEQRRVLRCSSSCGGTLGEVLFWQSMGVKTLYETSDCMPAAQRFIAQNCGKSVGHIFHGFNSQLRGHGPCSLHLGTTKSCVSEMQADRRQPIHLRSVGFPCRPHTSYRPRNGASGSRRSRRSVDHPEAAMMLSQESEWLTNNPHCERVLYEQVSGFANADPDTGIKPLTTFLQMLRGHGFSCIAIWLDCSLTQESSRLRLYIFGAKSRNGISGAATVASYSSRVTVILNYLKTQERTKLFGGLIAEGDMKSAREMFLAEQDMRAIQCIHIQ